MKFTITSLLTCCLLLLSNCDPGDSTLTSTAVPQFDVAVSLQPGQTRITNGQSATYNAAVTVTRKNDFKGAVSGTFELIGSSEERPIIGAWNGTLATAAVNIPEGEDTQNFSFQLRCSSQGIPPGTEGTLIGATTDSGHGARVCKGGCPIGCGRAGNPPCPLGCANAPVICWDDPVTIQGKFKDQTSGGVTILCMPSVGPTQ